MNPKLIETRREIEKHIENCTDIEKLLDGTTGGKSPIAKTHLLALYGEDTSPVFVSEYVALRVASKVGPTIMRNFERLAAGNPALLGWILEMKFFAHLKQLGDQKEALCFDTDTNCELEFPGTSATTFDPKKLEKEDLEKNWVQPIAWNQGGYDAVLFEKVEEKVGITFVQVTRAKAHSFKGIWFHKLVNSAVDLGFEVTKADIIILREKNTPRPEITPITFPPDNTPLAHLSWHPRTEEHFKDNLKHCTIDFDQTRGTKRQRS